VLAAHDGESSAVGLPITVCASGDWYQTKCRVWTPDEPRFICPLIKALATGAHCPVTCGMPHSVRGRGRPRLGLTGLGLRSIQHSPLRSQLNS
jgi:hypothetical protein